MKNHEEILVILINYNGLADTIECIESLKKSSKKVDILVVDNRSDNDEYIQIKNIFEDIKVIFNSQNLGFSAGNNIGIKYAIENGYKYVLILNNDTIITPNMIEKLMIHCDETTITIPLIYYYNNPKKLWYGGGVINKYTGNSQMFDYINTKSKNQSFASGCCMLINVCIFKTVGLFSDEYFMYCEDTEFCIRLNENNIKIYLECEAQMFHKVGQSTKNIGNKFSNYYNTRNRLKYIKDNKKYFKSTAYLYTLVTRYIRMMQLLLQKNPNWNIYLEAIKDYKLGIFGKKEFL